MKQRDVRPELSGAALCTVDGKEEAGTGICRLDQGKGIILNLPGQLRQGAVGIKDLQVVVLIRRLLQGEPEADREPRCGVGELDRQLKFLAVSIQREIEPYLNSPELISIIGRQESTNEPEPIYFKSDAPWAEFAVLQAPRRQPRS